MKQIMGVLLVSLIITAGIFGSNNKILPQFKIADIPPEITPQENQITFGYLIVPENRQKKFV